MKISIKNCSIEKIDGNDAIKFDITVGTKAIRCLEWLNGESVSRTDSHLQINDVEELADLFEVDRNTFTPLSDLIPFDEIYDKLDDYLKATYPKTLIMFMNTRTGSVDDYLGWDYENEDGESVNAGELGEVVEVIRNSNGWTECE